MQFIELPFNASFKNKTFCIGNSKSNINPKMLMDPRQIKQYVICSEMVENDSGPIGLFDVIIFGPGIKGNGISFFIL